MKYGWIWTGSNFIAAIFFYLFLPETKNRSLEEIDELFENRVSVKGFNTYHTKIAEKALRDVRGSVAENGSTGTETEKGVMERHVEKVESREERKREDMV